MRFSVFLLWALLALCSDALQDVETEKLQTEEVTHLNPDLENVVPKHTTNGSLLAVLAPPEKKKVRLSRSVHFQGSTLKWQSSYGSVPSGAVQIYNAYTKRYDYVCKYGCHAGFFNPSLGPQCRYPNKEKEWLGYPFEMLVNKDGFEILEWKADSQGGVPQHSVKTCLGYDVYVGKNVYGLGKVQVRHKAFFLPWEGREYWYNSYEVLTVNKDFYKEHMYDVRYNTSVEVVEHPTVNMRQSTIDNNQCRSVEKTMKLTKMFQEEKRWDTSTTSTANTTGVSTTGVNSTITAGIPDITSVGITVSSETTQTFSSGTTITKSTEYSVSVTQTVPPNHSCRVTMLGRKYEADIPFTARLKRWYRDGRTTEVSISGTFNIVSVGGVYSVLDQCKPLPDAEPCP